jgi:alpha-D-ribose 1-methylphosphonate 5-triphosphate synthase subunit PhnG
MKMANPQQSDCSDEDDLVRKRQEAMAVLAEATATEIGDLLGRTGPLPAHQEIRNSESGLVMVRGRISGDGAPFNVGEATVSRAAIRLPSSEVGFGYVLGRDHAKARLIAYCDALMQHRDYRQVVERDILAPLRKRARAARDVQAEQAAATKVEFFTLVRGED